MKKKIESLDNVFIFEQSLEKNRETDRKIFIEKPRISHYRIIQSGNVFEIYHSENPVGYNLTSSTKKKSGGVHKKNIHNNSIKRSRDAVARIINSNIWTYKNLNNEIYTPQFMTFTFREKVTEIQEANYYFNKFIKRLNYQLQKQCENNIQYINVIEFQKNGRVHFHSMFFNLFLLENERKDRWLANIWSHGFIEAKPLDSKKSAAGYMTKYLTKDKMDKRLITKKKYYCSRGIKRPIIITNEDMAIVLITKLNQFNIDYENQHTTPYGNTITYTKYNLDDTEMNNI